MAKRVFQYHFEPSKLGSFCEKADVAKRMDVKISSFIENLLHSG